eukprot:gene18204-24647_t
MKMEVKVTAPFTPKVSEVPVASCWHLSGRECPAAGWPGRGINFDSMHCVSDEDGSLGLVTAPFDAKVGSVPVAVGTRVVENALLVALEEA